VPPVAAYDPPAWSDLFVASAGASAALAGLVFVAVSINIDRILKLRGLPERALATMLLLLAVVLVSLIALIPGQSRTVLGSEMLVIALAFAAAIGRLSAYSLPKSSDPRRWLLTRLLLLGSATLPFIVAGASLIANAGGGLYWTGAGILFAITSAVTNAWVLLVEILR
jgi:hypothetical protein